MQKFHDRTGDLRPVRRPATGRVGIPLRIVTALNYLEKVRVKNAEIFRDLPGTLRDGFHRRRGLFNRRSLDHIEQLFIDEPLSLRKPFEQIGVEFGEAILQYCIGAAKPSCQCANCRWRDLSQCSFDRLPHWGEPLHLICLVGDSESTAQIRETIVQRHYVFESEVPSNRFDRNPGALSKGSTQRSPYRAV